MDAPAEFDDLLYGYGNTFSNFDPGPASDDPISLDAFDPHAANARPSQVYYDIEDQSGSACVVKPASVALPIELPPEPVKAPKAVQPAPPPKPEVGVINRLVKRPFGPKNLCLSSVVDPLNPLDDNLPLTSEAGQETTLSASGNLDEIPDQNEYDTDMLTTHLCRAFDVKGYESVGSFAREGLVLSWMLSRSQAERKKCFENGNRAFEERFLSMVKKNREKNAQLEEDKLEAEARALEADLLSDEPPESPLSVGSSTSSPKLEKVLKAKISLVESDASVPADAEEIDENFGIPAALETIDFADESCDPFVFIQDTESEVKEEVLEEPVSIPITPPGVPVSDEPLTEPSSFPSEIVKPEVKMETRMEEEEDILFLENEVAATQTSAVDVDIDEDGIFFAGNFQKEGTTVAVRSTDLDEPVVSPKECDGDHSDDDVDMESSGFPENAPAVVVSTKTPTHSTEPPVRSDAMERLLTDEESLSEERIFPDSQVFPPRENAESSVFQPNDTPSEVSVRESAPGTSSSVTMPPMESDGPSTSKKPDKPKRISKLPLIIPHKVVRKPRTSRSSSRSAARTFTKKASKPAGRKREKRNSGVSSQRSDGPRPSPSTSTSRGSGRPVAPIAPLSQVQGRLRRLCRSHYASTSANTEPTESVGGENVGAKIYGANAVEKQMLINSILSRSKKTAALAKTVAKDEQDAWDGWHTTLENNSLNISEDDDEEEENFD
ncbi:hypothetical protein RvY_04942 [Ramazzottius varieornatus]|uniref:Uncharacterized protein n=1 Tax=Ramazzottius varieornatus TaxID=947166 RepID=A0A1D1UTF0_RAMVA|nr:hypothetical protein RvY_04942 [Ramazzottius varieornatus]